MLRSRPPKKFRLRHDLLAPICEVTSCQAIKTAAGPTAPGGAGSPPDDASIIAAPASPVPGRHVCRVRWSIGARTKEPVIVASVDVMSLHYPHQMHRVGAAGKAPVSVVDVVADPLGAGEPLRAQSDRACAMLRLRNAMRHRPGFLVTE